MIDVQVLVQVGSGGSEKVLDITDAVQRFTLTTRRTVTPGCCTLALLPHALLDGIDMGNVVKIKDGGAVIHNGYVFKKRKTAEGIRLTTYDQIRYLENEDTVVLEDVTVTEALGHYIERFGLHAGALADTGFVIPSIVETKKAVIDIINDGLKDTVASTGELYTLYDEDGKLVLRNLRDMFLPYSFTEDTSVFSFEHSVSIDDNVYNQLKVVKQNPDDGVYESYVARDGDKIGRWGLLQMVHEAPEEYTDEMIDQLLETLAGLYGDPVVTMDVRVLGLKGLRGGNSVHIDMPGAMQPGWYLVDEVTHRYGDSGHLMDLRLLGVG